ncbi:MAG: hypothetical protein JRI39_02310 [Deltaproteobacteria bacterium]|nr:hypothetical protein [Deltaproteobacteria bacterium]MBW2081936.1 hypothetical protein [Deltaproteobacteria bacterium]HDM10658.1 hypothetical protein [Desulfobacteraceae bacterium]
MKKTASHKKRGPTRKELTLRELEQKVAQKGIQIHYDKLETAGLKLKGGLCKIRGEIHLYVDKRKSIEEKIAILTDCCIAPLAGIPESFPDESAENHS